MAKTRNISEIKKQGNHLVNLLNIHHWCLKNNIYNIIPKDIKNN